MRDFALESVVNRATGDLRNGDDFYTAVGEACRHFNLTGRDDFHDVAVAMAGRSAAKRSSKPKMADIIAKINANPRLGGEE